MEVQFVLNTEEGAELRILHGDRRSENSLHELPGRPARMGERDFSVSGAANGFATEAPNVWLAGSDFSTCNQVHECT